MNLLVVLDALLSARTLTLAARMLGLSQSATSHALARLRVSLDDPLFLREGRKLVPTARALALRTPLRHALAALEASLGQVESFDPSTATRTFQLASADYGQFVLLPPLLARLARDAPGVNLWVRSAGSGGAPPSLAVGETELLVTPPDLGDEPGPNVKRTLLFDERFVCVARKNHPQLRKRPVSLATWLALPHALVAPRGTPLGVVDHALRARGLERRIALTIPHFLVAPHAIAHSDLVLTVAERVARAAASYLPLDVFAPPIPLPGFRMAMYWHTRLDDDPGLAWLRQTLLSVARNDL